MFLSVLQSRAPVPRRTQNASLRGIAEGGDCGPQRTLSGNNDFLREEKRDEVITSGFRDFVVHVLHPPNFTYDRDFLSKRTGLD